jgi:NitT/TauT family transport system ATP-binding protein
MNSMNSRFLSVNQLNMVFSDGNSDLEALDDISFDLNDQEFLSIIGPSGSGKSTLIRAIAGLIPPTQGEIHFVKKNNPKIGLVFQKANLMPWRTVLQNITLPLIIEGSEKKEAEEKAQELIHLVGLDEFINSWPDQLSGGMAQRVSIARALIQDPDLLLLDEPFGALDALTRERMGLELLRIWQSSQKAVILVTHSISEALLLSDRILVLSQRPGKVTHNLPVNLPRPRTEDIRYSAEFIQFEKQLRDSLRDQVIPT